MVMEQMYWSEWAQKLRHGNMTSVALALLEGAGPVKYIVSQGVLAFLPFLDNPSGGSWKAFASMMENPDESRCFAEFLRGGNEI
jgi:hypothetical protein